MQSVKRLAVRTTPGKETGFIIEVIISNATESKGGSPRALLAATAV